MIMPPKGLRLTQLSAGRAGSQGRHPELKDSIRPYISQERPTRSLRLCSRGYGYAYHRYISQERPTKSLRTGVVRGRDRGTVGATPCMMPREFGVTVTGNIWS